jgi:signal transduction histidine kinase
MRPFREQKASGTVIGLGGTAGLMAVQSLAMGSRDATGVGELDAAPTVAAALRWTLPLAVVALGFLVAVTFRAHPGPGLHGQHLAVSAALIAYVAAQLGFEVVAASARWARGLLVVVMVVCAAVVVGIQPDGPGYLLMLPPVAAACFRFERKPAAAVAVFALAALAVGAALGRPRPINPVILGGLAVGAFYAIATFAGRFILADRQSQFMLAQLEQTRAAQAEAAALGERQRLAREMHDVLAHSLSGLVLNLEGARLMAERGVTGPKIEDAINRAHRLAKTGLEEAQRAIGMLRDDALPVPQRLEQLASEFEGDTGVRCQFTVQGEERPLSSDCHLALYRVAQEALTNIRKHACPDRVEVCLTYQPGTTRLIVEDFQTTEDPPPPGGGTGYGLTGMRERAELLGGTLLAAPTANGFRVELSAPG